MGREHEQLCLEDGCIAQWHVDSHLVTVEVGVKTGTYQRMQTDSFTFYQFGLECLDTKTVQRRSTVEQDRMSF